MTDSTAGCPGAAELVARRLPAALVAPRPDAYARRLLPQDPDGRYTAVVMTWGPGSSWRDSNGRHREEARHLSYHA